MTELAWCFFGFMLGMLVADLSWLHLLAAT